MLENVAENFGAGFQENQFTANEVTIDYYLWVGLKDNVQNISPLERTKETSPTLHLDNFHIRKPELTACSASILSTFCQASIIFGM